jgi:hypothetical protein
MTVAESQQCNGCRLVVDDVAQHAEMHLSFSNGEFRKLFLLKAEWKQEGRFGLVDSDGDDCWWETWEAGLVAFLGRVSGALLLLAVRSVVSDG